MEKFVDPGFIHHLAIGRLWVAHALLISESDVLPFNLVQYANQMKDYFADFDNYYTSMLAKQNITLGTHHFI